MSWFIIGDSKHAGFAGDTGMHVFGPLHTCYGGGDAKRELMGFAKTLDEDPRLLHREGELRDLYHEWRKE